MSFGKNDVKQGIDKAAKNLKTATDKLAARSQEAGESITAKAKELARRTGEQMIDKGTKLRKAGR
jgi:hypothetical protein